MSKQRLVKDEIWDDEWFYDLDPSEKLVWLFLLTNPRCNIAGVYKMNYRWASGVIGFEKDTLENILSSFEKEGKILRTDCPQTVSREYMWIIISNWLRHQSNNPSVIQGIVRILQETPLEIRELWLKVQSVDRLSPDCLTLLNSTLLNLSDSETDVSQKTIKKKV